VLLDLVMKGMNGLDVLAKLRLMDPAARVIVVSADVQHSSRELAHDAGASAFVIKPVSRPEILKAVADVLEVIS
jgi:two-component system chemotaxis response regulator CheY